MTLRIRQFKEIKAINIYTCHVQSKYIYIYMPSATLSSQSLKRKKNKLKSLCPFSNIVKEKC